MATRCFSAWLSATGILLAWRLTLHEWSKTSILYRILQCSYSLSLNIYFNLPKYFPPTNCFFDELIKCFLHFSSKCKFLFYKSIGLLVYNCMTSLCCTLFSAPQLPKVINNNIFAFRPKSVLTGMKTFRGRFLVLSSRRESLRRTVSIMWVSTAQERPKN